jgi:PST family polysaccharide transporter/lipopolysaccharide exporter
MSGRLRTLVEGLVPTGSLLERSAKSGVWMTGVRVFTQGLQLVMLVVLARLLTPSDFGVLGVALLALSAVKQFSRIGVDTALIQQREEDVDGYLDTAWVLEVARGAVVAGTLYLLAPLVADLFGEPSVTGVLRCIGLSPLLYGLRNPAVVYFRKGMEFHKEFVYQTSTGLVRFLVGVGYAMVDASVWALVFAFVSADATRLVLSYVLDDYRPRPVVDREALTELVDYGKWITGSSITHFLYSEGDDAFVGWYLSPTMLGFYQYAHRIADLPAKEISAVVSSVTFPAYSRLQDDLPALRTAVRGTARMTAFVAFPVAAGLALVAPAFVPAVLGADWRPMVVPLQLLAVFGLIHAITRDFGGVFNALGRPDLNVKLDVVRIACLLVVIWPATARWGIDGTAAAVVGVYVLPMFPLDVHYTAKLVGMRSVDIYRQFAYPALASGVMFASLWHARGRLDVSPLVELLALVPSAVVVYGVTVLTLDRASDWGIERDIRRIVAGVRS